MIQQPLGHARISTTTGYALVSTALMHKTYTAEHPREGRVDERQQIRQGDVISYVLADDNLDVKAHYPKSQPGS